MSNDPSTSSNYKEFVTTNVTLDWEINFQSQTLSGFCDLQFCVVDRTATVLKLDTRDLHIIKVVHLQNASKCADLTWELKPVTHIPSLGSVLHITVPNGQHELSIRIYYRTDPTATALQWLEPSQTLGRKHPYMFSQCQDIHARSILPCQDTPAIKCPYQATVTGPSELIVLMSGIRQGDIDTLPEKKMSRHVFRQSVSIPIYLLAIVCGHLDSRELGPRSRVWCEPEMVEAAAQEFEATERMICAAEGITGIPYVWHRYDLLVLPPSFPYGGMENPCLTFVTPTLLAGDRSLVSVIAHEIAHSWTGNLVTNSSWEHFWLNEGHTVYLERLILEALVQQEKGADDAEKHRHLCLQLGYKEFCVTAQELIENFTRLVPDLSQVDPGDYFSRIPYEKGSLFLFHLEGLVGKQRMLTWLNRYLTHFANKSLTSEQWKDFLTQNLESQGVDKDVLMGVNFQMWFYGHRLPTWTPSFDTTLTRACEELASAWMNLAENGNVSDDLVRTYEGFSTIQKFYFWKQLRTHADALPLATVVKLETAYGMRQVNNAEIRFEWLLLCAQKQYDAMLDNTIDFLNSQGRLKYTVPLYKLLSKWEVGRERALANFSANRIYMHNNTSKRVEDILFHK